MVMVPKMASRPPYQKTRAGPTLPTTPMKRKNQRPTMAERIWSFIRSTLRPLNWASSSGWRPKTRARTYPLMLRRSWR